MRISIILPIAAALVAAAIGMSTPAAATVLSEAVKLCNLNPNCSVGPKANGWTNIKVGKNEIVCPDKGECVCLQCSPPQRIETGNNGPVVGPRGGGIFTLPKRAVGSVLNSGSVPKNKPSSEPKSTPTAEPKPVPTAEPKPAPSTPTTTQTRNARDHRGTGGGGGTTVTTTRYPYDIGKSDSGRKGPSKQRLPGEIRDHRGADVKPQVRDHRSSNVPAKTASSNTPPKNSGSGGTICGTPGNPLCQPR